MPPARDGLAVGLAVAIALFFGLFAIPPVDRDESRFAQASAQMAAGDSLGDWVVPRVQDTPRLNKPPLIYWLQAMSTRIAAKIDATWDGNAALRGIGWYRLPSALCSIMAALLTWWLAWQMCAGEVKRRRCAMLAGILLGVCTMVMWDGRQARADQLLLACTTCAMAGLWGVWKGRGDKANSCAWIVLWIGIALGIMAKGPITPMVAGLTAIGLTWAKRDKKWLRRTRPVLGIAIVLAIGLPWVLLVMREVGAKDYLGIIWDETVGRSASAKEGHWGLPGYHFVLLPVMFFPGSLLTAAAVWQAIQSGKSTMRGARIRTLRQRVRRLRRFCARMDDVSLFCLAWIVPSWIVFELVGTKLPHYVLPLYPALAILSARAVMRGVRCGRVGAVVWAVLGVAIVGVAPMFLLQWGDFGWAGAWRGAAIAGAIAACAMVIAAAALAWRGRTDYAQAMGVIGMVIGGAVTFGIVLPGIEKPWISARLNETIAQHDADGARAIALVGYHEDSMIFLTRGRAERMGKVGVAAWSAQHPDGLILCKQSALEDVVGQLPLLREIARVRGFNYANGEEVEVVVGEVR